MNPPFRFVQRRSLAVLLLAAAFTAQAQTGGVRLGTAGTPDPSAVLDLRPDAATTPKGFLPPRLSTGQRDAITNPAAGLTVFNTTTGQLNVWNGTKWVGYLADTIPSTSIFAYTGAPQTYTVPAGVTSLRVDMAGAAGGPILGSSTSQSLGGRVQATLAVTPGQVLTIYVGGAGAADSGGYNGGGGASGFDGGGGGASDIRQGGTALANRVLVAGGGGGGGDNTDGGCGGGLTACAGSNYASYTGGGGGSQTSAGVGGFLYGNPGVGETGGAGNSFSGGGGGGYFGGGGGGNLTGGGGGSSYAGAGTSAVVHTQGTQPGAGYVLLTPLFDNAPAPVLDASNFTNLPPAQTLSVNGQTLSISGGNTVTVPEAQTLSVSGQNLSISGGNTVAVPGDNLGNHTATQNLNLGANQLVGNGGSSGLAINSAGRVGIGVTAPAAPLEVQAGAALTGANTGTTTQLRLTRPGTSGTKWNSSAELAVGTYTTGTNAQSQLDFKLGQNNNATADQIVLTLRGDGYVGIGALAPAAKLDVAGTVKLGAAGSVLTGIIKTTVNYDVGNITANTIRVESLTVAGARPGATVFVSPSTGFASAVIAWARVSANDTVEIGFTTATTTDPASKDYYITVIQ